MNLIDLKQAPIVDKAQEGATLFALNTDGTVERISAENVGGSGAKIAKMTADMSALYGNQESAVSLQNLKDGVSTLSSSGSTTFTATCDNMTFEEAVAIIKSGEKLDIMMSGDLSAVSEGMTVTGYALLVAYQPAATGGVEKVQATATPEKIGFLTMEYGGNITFFWEWSADGISTTIG